MEDYRRVLQEIALTILHHGDGELIAMDCLREKLLVWDDAAAEEMTRKGNLIVVAHFFQEAELDKQKFVEFSHKSFREYLIAERLMAFLKASAVEMDVDEWWRIFREPFTSEIFAFLRDMIRGLTPEERKAVADAQMEWTKLAVGSPKLRPIARRYLDDKEFDTVLNRSVTASATAMVVLATAVAATQEGADRDRWAGEVRDQFSHLYVTCQLPSSDRVPFSTLWRGVQQSCNEFDLLPAHLENIDVSDLPALWGRHGHEWHGIDACSVVIFCENIAIYFGYFGESEFGVVENSSMTNSVCLYAYFPGDVVDSSFSGTDFGGSVWGGMAVRAKFDECMFTAVTFRNASYTACSFANSVLRFKKGRAVFTYCNFSSVVWPEAPGELDLVFVNCTGALPPWAEQITEEPDMLQNIAPQMLLNADAIAERVGFLYADDHIQAIAAAIASLDDPSMARLADDMAVALSATCPEIKPLVEELESRQEVRGGEADAVALLADIWNTIRSDGGVLKDIALLVLFLRGLGENKIKVPGLDYEGGSVLADLAKLIDAARGKGDD